jgi:cytoskeletal protein CcmA (bactofilin family)
MRLHLDQDGGIDWAESSTMTAPATPTSTPLLDGAVTVIPASLVVCGSISGDTALVVHGRVEGRVELAGHLEVAATGIVEADVVVRSALVRGIVCGSLRAQEFVELTDEARMIGDIHAPRVILAEGTSFRGSVEMGASAPPSPHVHGATAEPPSERASPSSIPTPLLAIPSTPATAAATSSTASATAAVLGDDDQARRGRPKGARLPLDPPAAAGLASKTLKAHVVVKRRS